jgi:hypothetical protein
VVLDWSPFALLSNHVAIDRFAAARVQVLRAPAGDGSAGDRASPRMDVEALSIARLETSAEVSRVPMALSVQGGLHYASLQDVGAKLEVVRRDGGIIPCRCDFARWQCQRRCPCRRARTVGRWPPRVERYRSYHAQRPSLWRAGQIRWTSRSTPALHAAATGTIDFRPTPPSHLPTPAMALRPDLSGDALSAEGNLRGASRSQLLRLRPASAVSKRAAARRATLLRMSMGQPER